MSEEYNKEIKLIILFIILYVGYYLYNNFKGLIVVVLLFLAILLYLDEEYLLEIKKQVSLFAEFATAANSPKRYDGRGGGIRDDDQVDITIGDITSIIDNSWSSASVGPKHFLAPHVKNYDEKLHDRETVSGFSDHLTIPHVLRGHLDKEASVLFDILSHSRFRCNDIVNPHNVKDYIGGPIGMFL